MSKRATQLEVVDPSGLTDADWAEINKLREAYESGSKSALSTAIEELASNPTRYVSVMGAFFPETVAEAIKDQMAARGITMEDLQELVRKLESGSGSKH